MSTAKATARKRRAAEPDLAKSASLDLDLDLSSDIKGIMSALQQIREKAHKDGLKKNEETISSVASEVRSVIDEMKSKVEKDRQSFAKSLSKSSKECENCLKTETTKFQAVYEKFCKDQASHLQTMKAVEGISKATRGGSYERIRIGRGTTIMGVIQGDTIYIVSDGRRSCTIKDIFLVQQGDDKKIGRVTEKICATTAGEVLLGDDMLKMLQMEAKSSQDFQKMITKLTKYREQHLKEMIKERGRNKNKNKVKNPFKVQFGLYSVDAMNGRPYIQIIGSTKKDDNDAYKDGVVVGSGTGAEAAERHFKRRMKHRIVKEPHEVMSYMKLSVVESGLGDKYTGGFIQGAILSPDGLFINEQNEHMIRLLADHYAEFSDILKTKLLCISRRFAYGLENERIVTNDITKQFSGFPRDLPSELLLGVHANILIVRCVCFCDEATTRNALDSLGRRGPFMPVTLPSGVYQIEYRMPTQNELRQLARDFVDQTDL